MVKSILCLDIGSGTQDVLYWQEDLVLENCPKFVLPAPARRVMARLRELTAAGQAVYLHGTNMGGGFYRAAMAHVKAGLPLAAHPDAAYSLADDLGQLEKLGVAVREERPAGHVPVPLADYDPGFWQALLGAAGLPMPELVLACAQDHGFHPGSSNRIGRFNLWRQFLIEAAGRPAWLLFRKPPPELTRLAALQRAIGGGPVADTGAAAVLGALYDPGVARTAADEGVCLVNAGNSHVIAFLLYAGRHVRGLRAPHGPALGRGAVAGPDALPARRADHGGGFRLPGPRLPDPAPAGRGQGLRADLRHRPAAPAVRGPGGVLPGSWRGHDAGRGLGPAEGLAGPAVRRQQAGMIDEKITAGKPVVKMKKR